MYSSPIRFHEVKEVVFDRLFTDFSNKLDSKLREGWKIIPTTLKVDTQASAFIAVINREERIK